MLIKMTVLQKIKSGQIDLVFRRWKKPTVKTGGTLKTGVGLLVIEGVEQTEEKTISEADALRAGFSSRDTLLQSLGNREGALYKIKLKYGGGDPRLQLRERAELSQSELAEIGSRLTRMDVASKAGVWTQATLQAIKDSPKLAATELADKMRFEKAWLKNNIRKLKNMGLTISHERGYTLSPRGEAVLEYLRSLRE